MINAIDYGFIPNDDTFDNTSKFNAFLGEVDSVLYFPKGKYYFLSKPNVISKTVTLFGENMSDSHLLRAYAPASQFETFIVVNDGYGTKISDLGLVAAKNSTTGMGVTFISQSNGKSIDYSILENLYISGEVGSNWSSAMWLYGSPRQSSPSGLRDIYVNNVHLFASTYSCLEISTVIGAHINCATFSAGGSTDLVRINGWASIPSSNIHLENTQHLNMELNNIHNLVTIAPSYAVSGGSNVVNAKYL